MHTLAAFKSRSEAFRLSRALKEMRYANTVINTPRSLGVSCGLSVVFADAIRAEVEGVIGRLGFKTFLGIYVK